MAFRPEADLTCSICRDVFKDPVVLTCSHSFCNNCVKSWWWDKQECECPVCKSVSQTRQPPRNLALRNLCEAAVPRKGNEDAGGVCGVHSERFKLFCLDHQEPVCVVCRDSHAHSRHRFRPIDEAAQEGKKKVLVSLLPLKKKLKLFEEAKEQFEEKEKYMKTQAEHAEARIKEQFKKLYRFLQKEEKKRIAALRYEGKNNRKWFRLDFDDLSKNVALLSETIRVTKKELQAESLTFLQNLKSAEENIQRCIQLKDPPASFGSLINVAEHLGNLTRLIWTKMEDTISCTPVFLDPSTAHPHLAVSEDLTSLRYRRRKKVLRIPETIDYYRCVLGSESFNSGSHTWDVEVGDSGHWGLGVAAWLAYWKKDLKSGLWIIKFQRNEYSAMSPQDEVRLHHVKMLKKIRVRLRCDRRKLSFYDPDTGAHIHSFTQIADTRLYPYFSNGKRSPLRILPANSSTNIPPLIIIGFIMMMTTLVSILTLI